jgi:hypothetical protein
VSRVHAARDELRELAAAFVEDPERGVLRGGEVARRLRAAGPSDGRVRADQADGDAKARSCHRPPRNRGMRTPPVIAPARERRRDDVGE